MSTASQDYLLPNEYWTSSTGAGFKGASQSNGLFGGSASLDESTF